VKKTSIIILLVFLAFGAQPEIYSHEIPKERLVLVKTFPEDGLPTKAVPWIDVDSNGNIYAVGNREHTIFKFNLEGKQLLTFGGWGQGPGELQWPSKVSIEKESNQIFIKDNTGISIYDPEGRFIHKIRTFVPPISLCAVRSGVLLLQPAADKKEMINFYDNQGKLISSFGEKYQANYALSKEIQPAYLDLMANNGKVLSDGKYIYYISYVFGEIQVFDFLGKSVMKKRIVGIKNLEKIRKDCEHLFFEGGIKRNKNGTVTERVIFNDSYLASGNIYLLMLGYVEDGPYQILSLSRDGRGIKERFLLPGGIQPENMTVINLAKEDGIRFIASFCDKVNETNLIGIFKKEVTKGKE
jgi:hypothetical protein